MKRVGIPGAAGRMGRALVAELASAEDLELSAAAEAPGSAALGQDAGLVAGARPLGVPIGADLRALVLQAEGVIDFTAPKVTAQLAPLCAERGLPLVVGTTGLGSDERALLAHAAERSAVVCAPNMSVGVNVLLRLVADAARLLGPEYDLEIVEAHHRHKKDAPSGTALRLAEALAQATCELGPLSTRLCTGRQGDLPERPSHQIGVLALRGGDVVGDHTVYYCTEGERVEITHRASNRRTFARGALRALRWAAKHPPGLYDMQDVLGLK
ncbi:MAG: 4-hydroxy-tetrahydrodipicolinate reductase [Deltaproteobacteria bacterium]|nr:4-hydroxy-tetrahydrodipicolinate reductase [Deltaproteobacteria bacterium]